jgi:hypothetical protein
LFAVDLAQRGIRPMQSQWATPALAGSDTRDVQFSEADAVPVGGAGDYVGRPGFWHGAVGVAAVWYGGALGVADAVLAAAHRRTPDDVGLVQLAGVDVALSGAGDVLARAAEAFDADPDDRQGRAAIIARRARAVVESAVEAVMTQAGHALGPGALAGDREHAQRIADLQLYVRQSHAERDLVDLGRRLLDSGIGW